MENTKKSLLRLRLRVTAKKRGMDPSTSSGAAARKIQRECVNSVNKLQRREIGAFPRMVRGASSNAPEKFRNIQLQEEFDTYDQNVHWFLKLQFLKKRSKIIEIVAAKDVIFALAQSGLCAAFSRTTNRRICFLNISPDEVIRSLFYNKNNDSLITVSVYASDHFSSLKCRTTPVEYIRRSQLDAGFPLFETESLKWPGFVEFDDVNGKVLTYSAQDGIYKVFDLKNYSFLYSISDKNVQEIKISPGIMLLIYHRTPGYVPLKILSIEDGTVLKSFSHLLHRNKKVDFIEQFNEKLLVKQENENLQILDVRNTHMAEVSRTEFMTPSAFIFLYENHLFLTFRNRTVAVWNFRGELVTSFEDHLLWHPDCNTNNIYITSDQDLIISYCKAEEGCEDEGEVSAVGSINMSNILTGKCIAKICSSDPTLQISPRRRGDSGRSSIRSTVREALEDVTEKREKSKDSHNSSKRRDHGHKKRKHEEQNEPSRKDGLWKEAASKDVAELLEKSGLTEEHGPTCATQEHCASSESTQNSSKSRKLEVPNSSSGSHGNTVIRLRLPLQKHRDPKPTPPYVKDLKATPANEGNCFSARSRITSKDLRATPASEGPCFSGRTTSEVPTASPSSEGPCFSARAPPKDPKVIAASKGPCFSVPATLECFSGRPISKDRGAVPANEATACISGRATEVPLMHKLSDTHIRSVERGKLQLSNVHSLSVENIKPAEVPHEQKLDEDAHAHPGSSSKGSKRARKLDKHFRDLIGSWKPAPLFLDAEPGTEDLGWLFGNSGQHRVKSDATSRGVGRTVADIGRGSSAFPFQPKALYLPELEMYQLPYVVPF